MASDFVHLHLHTQYSLLDGGIHLPRLFSKAKDLGFNALAITDHGNMFGAVDFYKRAKAAGIHPIIGCEAYVAPKSRFEKSSHRGLSDAAYHLVLLVKDETGYKNLVKLSSAAYLEGFYYKPRIDRELLREHSEGLIGLSACLKGEIPWLIRHNNYDKAKRRAQEYAEIFGEGNFYIEIQRNGLEEQEEANAQLISLANEVGLPLVVTNDCHYLDPEDAEAHDVLLCIQTGKHVDDTDRMRMSTNQLYLRSPQEVAELFSDLEEAVKNTVEIANRCNFEFTMHQYKLPQYKVPSGYTLHTYLEELARGGLERRRDAGELDSTIPFEEYQKRLETELTIIEDMGFAGYFLIVWEFIDFAKRKGIPVGPGRGSAAGSLVSYALRITSIDPLRYHLLFERFLNPERISMPDIDVDICMNRRDEVVEHVRQLYGEENVAKIITFGTLSARAVVRDVGRALNLPYGEVDTIAKLIPPLSSTIQKALEEQPKLTEMMKEKPEVKRLIEIAQRLEGLYRHASTHAAGVVITPQPLTEYLPLYKASDKGNGEVVTQYAKDEVEELGLLKMDLLGLKTLTILDMAVKLAERYKEVDSIDLDHLPLDDQKTFKLLCSGQTTGVFQLESSGMRELIKKMQPSRFEDIIALVALYRPGPLESGMVDDYINRRHGRVEVTYPLPQLEPILKETYGIILYQEQVMQIAVTLAGYTMGQADLLRKAMGKKKPELMQKERSRFMEGALKNGVPEEKAREIFDLMEKFAGYGFNKSHSAAYAMIAYQTAYMKAHHPVAFMAALISGDMGNTDKIYKYIKECADMGIEVLPPDINDSDVTFSVKGNSLRFGLAAIKNVGEAAVESIVKERAAKGPFKSLYDFCRRVDLHKVNRKTLESLIKAGAFDSTGKERHVLLGALDKAMEEAGRRNKAGRRGQVSLFDLGGKEAAARIPEWYPEIPPLSQKELLDMEKEALGFYITSHPMEMYSERAREVTDLLLERVHSMKDGTEVVVCGMVAKKKELSTKKKERMAIVQLEDTTSSLEVVVFPSLYREVELALSVNEEPFVVKGRVDSDSASEGTNKVLAEEMVPLSEAEGRFRFKTLPSSLSFVIEMDRWEGNGDLVMKLFDLVRDCKGKVPLRLVFERRGDFRAVVEALEDFWVDPGLLEQSFGSKGGFEGVRLVKEN